MDNQQILDYYISKFHEVTKDLKMDYGQCHFLILREKGQGFCGINLADMSTKEVYGFIFNLVKNPELKAPWYRKLELAVKILF